MFGNFYSGFMLKFYWFCLVIHFVEDIFLAIIEIALMMLPVHMTFITVGTFAVYMVMILEVQPFEEALDVKLTMAEGTINIFATLLAWQAETSEESTLPLWVVLGLYACLSTQLFFIPYAAWPIIGMAKLELQHATNKQLLRFVKFAGSKGRHGEIVMRAGLIDPVKFDQLISGGVNDGVCKKLIKTRQRRAASAMRTALLVNRFKRKMLRVVYARRERLRNAAQQALGLGDDVQDDELLKVFNEIDLDGSGHLDKRELRVAMLKLGKSEADIDVLIGEADIPPISSTDVGKFLYIEDDEVFVDGVARTVNWGDAKHHDLQGTIKSVEEKFKGKVELEDGQEFENGDITKTHFDGDGDGLLDFQEFREMLLTPEELERRASVELLKVFNEIDTDGSGHLDQDELRAAMLKLGKSLSEIEAVLHNNIAESHFDKDGDGLIDFQEFRAMLLSTMLLHHRLEQVDHDYKHQKTSQ